MEAKEKENRRLRKQQSEPQNPHTSDSYPSLFPKIRGSNRAPPRTKHPCAINMTVTRSIPRTVKFHQKDDDVFQGAHGNCHRAKMVKLFLLSKHIFLFSEAFISQLTKNIHKKITFLFFIVFLLFDV